MIFRLQETKNNIMVSLRFVHEKTFHLPTAKFRRSLGCIVHKACSYFQSCIKKVQIVVRLTIQERKLALVSETQTL